MDRLALHVAGGFSSIASHLHACVGALPSPSGYACAARLAAGPINPHVDYMIGTNVLNFISCAVAHPGAERT